MKLDLYEPNGILSKESLELEEDFFPAKPNEHLVHTLLKLQLTRPTRTANTKTRAEVRGGGAKPWKQKGTGRARAGSIRSPLWRKGGVTFGPRTHQISFTMPRKARRSALRSALALRKDYFRVMSAFPSIAVPQTKQAVAVITQLGLSGKKILLLVDPTEHANLSKSFQNIQKVKVISWQNLNPHDILNCDFILADKKIINSIQAWLLDLDTTEEQPVVLPELSEKAPKRSAALKEAEAVVEKAAPKEKKARTPKAKD